jgi:16S rRNA (adenine1518-N6/adenine1519-N6)-dimethyltransferase
MSQNFLVDPAIAREIVSLCRVGPEDVVIEVGSGLGALTGHLLERAKHLFAVELDRNLAERLGVEYGSKPGFSLHIGDILQVQIRDLVPEGKAVVVGNLPYAITSDLILWLLEQHDAVRRAVLLMQREVAERLTAAPGSRGAGSLTLAVRYRAESERLLDIPPAAFRPRPKVVSTLVAFRFLDKPLVTPKDERFFFRVIRAAFGERRKTLVNALMAGLSLPRPVIEQAVGEAGLDLRIRGERLDLEDFRRLADLLGDLRDHTLLGSEGRS